MRETLAISMAVAADAVRRKIVWVVVLFAAGLALAVPSLPSYGVGVDLAVFREVTIALTWVASMIVVLALAAPRIPMELERRTVYSVLGRDVRRWQYLLGTWLGIAAVMFAVVLAFVVVTLGVGAIRYGGIQWRLLESGLAVWSESVVVAAFAVALSTVTGTVVTVMGSLVFLFVGHAYGSLLPEGAARFAPSLDVFNVVNPVAHGTGIAPLYAFVMVGAAVAWTVVLLVLGTLAFDRKDL